MKTLQKPILNNTEAKSTCSQEDFLASLFHVQDEEKGKQILATSGRKCSDVLRSASPLGYVVKTLLESSQWLSKVRYLVWKVKPLCSERITLYTTNTPNALPSSESSVILKTLDMKSSRLLFQLAPSELPTDETESLSSHKNLLPTPNTMDYNTTWSEEAKERCLQRRAMEGKKAYPGKFNALKQMAVEGLLPTPTAIEGSKGTNTYNPASQMGQSLSAMAGSGLLPTPRACSAMAAPFTENTPKNPNKNLEVVISALTQGQLLPTPLTTEIEHQKRVSELRIIGGKSIHSRANGESRPNGIMDFLNFNGLTECCKQTDGPSSRLSPLFTEEMMGFPLMWTTLPFLSQNGEQNP